MSEIWKEIEGYEGFYQVSDKGRVKSLGNDKARREKILKPSKSKKGYLKVGLSRNNNHKFFLVHRLVAQAFIPNPDKLPEVNHKDCNPSNDFVGNLEWVDRLTNNRYGQRGAKIARALAKTVYQYDSQGNLLKTYASAQQVQRETGFSQSHISACCRGERKTAGGFIWRYSKIRLF